MRVSRDEKVTLFVDPYMLRKMADEMERHMKEARLGQRVWSESFRGDDVEIVLMTDQDWFHRRERGIPNWEAMTPGESALARFVEIAHEELDEDYEFPKTYSGSAWHATYRIWKATRECGEKILDEDDVPEAHGLGLSGFQFGWAVNAVRQMLGKKPGTNPAILVIGGPQPVVPAAGAPEDDMRKAIGG